MGLQVGRWVYSRDSFSATKQDPLWRNSDFVYSHRNEFYMKFDESFLRCVNCTITTSKEDFKECMVSLRNDMESQLKTAIFDRIVDHIEEVKTNAEVNCRLF